MDGALFHLSGQPVTAYAAGMALSVLIAALLWMKSARAAGFDARTAEAFTLLALLLGLAGARLAYVLIRLPFFLERPLFQAFKLWQGGATLWGALAGFLLAGLLAARQAGVKPGALLDAAAPAGLLLLALGRFCEGLAGQGFGEEAAAGLSFFPFAVQNAWGEWRWAVFLLEGCAALLFLLLILRGKSRQPGDRARLALILLCAFQLVFESLREDEFLRWGFVRAGQLVPALILLALLVYGLRSGRSRWRRPGHLAVAAFLLLILVVAGAEYALDKTEWSTLFIYAAMLAAALCITALATRAALGGKDG